VSISGMTLTGDALETRYDISNQNGVAMNIDAFEVTVRVKSNELTRHQRRDALLIDPNSTEEVSHAETASDFTRNLLRSLENGTLDSVAFDLQGHAQTREDGRLDFEQRGYLYRVPGRPGQFRAAVTQANELIREDTL
jgi:hypothetical protein